MLEAKFGRRNGGMCLLFVTMQSLTIFQAPPILLGAICKHLSEHQDLQDQLREDPALIPAAVEEFIRLYSPYRSALCPSDRT